MVKKILLSLLVVFIAIQFIRPSKNSDERVETEMDIGSVYPISSGVHQILKEKCYDCHSNNTSYPWYFNLQPVGWWMASHINEGKEELNFSTFKNYPQDRAHHKLEEMMEVITDGSMPLESYTFIHHSAKISPAEAASITQWLTSMGIEPESH